METNIPDTTEHNDEEFNEKEFKKLKQKSKDSIKVYINSNEKIVSIVRIIYLKVLDEIFKNLDYKRHKRGKKIYFDYQLWVDLHNKEIFKKNGMLVHVFISKLIEEKLIARSSKIYPKNQMLLSINPLSKAFLHTDLNEFDRILDLRDKFIKDLINTTITINYEIQIYIYFRLFSLENIPLSYYSYMVRDNILHLNDNVAMVVQLEEHKEFIPLKTIIFNKSSSEILNSLFPKSSDINLLNNNQYIFSNDFNYYENELKQYCKKYNLRIRDVKRIIELEMQLRISPLQLTLLKYTKHPNVSLLELDKLYPDSISSELLDIERNNLAIYRKYPSRDEDDEIDIDKFLGTNYELYDKFKQLRKVPTKKGIKGYLTKSYLFIEANKHKEKQFTPIFNYVYLLLNEADSNYRKKPILPTTLQAYLQVIFEFCFNIIVTSPNIEDAIKRIDNKIRNSDYAPDVQVKYQNRINDYLLDEMDMKMEKINPIIHYNRSIVFEDELDKLIAKLKYRDKVYTCEILKSSRAVYSILAYYSGLRKNELRSRQLRDFYKTTENKFILDVNKKGIIKINKHLSDSDKISLKNRNAKRRVEFSIDNKRHLKIVEEYYELITQEKVTFIFPNITKRQIAAKKRAVANTKLEDINKLLQKTTGRYTVIHSFRHTYATNEMVKILNKEDKSINDIFDLIQRIGHGDPEIMLSYYVHLDLIKINTSKF